MSSPPPPAGRVPSSYDAVARAYAAAIGDELDGKPLDRALLDALLELTGAGTVADLGCGPGHVTRYLAARHRDVIGIDVSPGMIAVARADAPELDFTVASMVALPSGDATLAGAVALYSLIHLDAGERAQAAREFARAIRPGGWLLVAFHVEDAEHRPGDVAHFDRWLGAAVDLDFRYLDPAGVRADLVAAGFEVMAELVRQPIPDVEHASRRCYLLARRR